MHSLKKFFHHMLANYAILFFGIIILIIVLIGTLCFHFIEHWDLFHSFYFTTVTMATVWYGDMAPATYAGKIFAIIYGFMWAPLFVWLTSILLQFKFQKVIKNSIHEYHKEIKEAQIATKSSKKIVVVSKPQNDISSSDRSRRKKIFHTSA